MRSKITATRMFTPQANASAKEINLRLLSVTRN
jgi:hypothetical protein